MCEFCTEHGEGKKWYTVMQNYSAEMLAQKDRQHYIKHFIPNVQRHASSNITKLAWAKRSFPAVYRFIRQIGSNHIKNIHFGQVLPLEDAEQVLALAQSITRIACVCRSVTTGNKNARYCFMLGIDPEGMGIDYGDLKESLETLSHEEAIALLRQFDQEGLVHSVWTLKTPYIGALCNCDHQCLAYKVQIQADLMELMFKGECCAHIDMTLCSGCKQCVSACQFAAIEYAHDSGQCIVHSDKCYGCGVCRNVCQKNAIYLAEKINL